MTPIQPALPPFDILRLVGFATGATLHLYLCLMLYHRYGFRRAERSLLGLGLIIGLWHLGNFAAAVYELIAASGGSWWIKTANSIAYASLAFLPPTLAHSHFRIWGWFDKEAPSKYFKPLIVAGYLPLIILPWAIARLWEDPYRPPIDSLANLLLPFILWLVFVFIECAMIDLRLAGKVKSIREQRFFKVFGASMLVIGALFLITYVFGGRHWGALGRYLELLSRLSSIAPTTIIAYYIYRYRYLELVIRQSLVYAVVAAVVMIVYIHGIRRLSIWLEQRYGIRADVIEAMLILIVILLAEPLRRLTEGYLRRLFAREVGLYRELVAQVGSAASNFGELARFIDFTERRLTEALELEDIRIIPNRPNQPGEAGHLEAIEVCRIAEDRHLAEIEEQSLLERLQALAAHPLWREDRVVGLLMVRGDPQSLTAEKREVLAVLAGHIAVAVENSQLLEEKVKLERELAERERLASLGQMAATVAHEVKNPLSAIKSITQVMREDRKVSDEYGRDLDLITGEVDRLNRSVTQLLSFSRPSVVAASSASLGQIIESVVAVAKAETEPRNISISFVIATDLKVSGEKAAALKEILLNIVLNASQATQRDGHITINAGSNGGGRLRVSVTDDGIGIPESMQQKIFEPFFTTKQRGTGLGLAIVARRVRDLDGEVGLTSPVKDGRGTRFDIDLPA